MKERWFALVVRRLWWALLPYAGWMTYDGEEGAVKPPWYAYPLAWLWNGVHAVMVRFGVGAFPPSPPIVCNCDYCRGVPGAVFEW
jgi:hypothetical protein